MRRLIDVRPTRDGWSVDTDVPAPSAKFSSGAQAEAAARRLCSELAKQGEDAQLRVYLHDGSLAGGATYRACRLVLAD